MVRSLAALLLLAPAASASPAALAPAAVSFEGMAAELHASVAALRTAQIENAAAESAGRIDALAWDLERHAQETSRLREDLRWLQNRINSRGRSETDPNLRWDVQSFSRDLARLARDADSSLIDLRVLLAKAVKDDALVAPAQRLRRAAQAIKNESHWLDFDARFAVHDFRRAGFDFEAMDLERDARDVDGRAQALLDDADRLLAKVSGS